MKLSKFILTNLPLILSEWDVFARSLDPTGQLSSKEIRDHAKQILQAIAVDIDTPQSVEEQRVKSLGLSPDELGKSGASTHGMARQNDGFTVLQLTAEFRALRATVQRLWFACGNELTPEHSKDLIRFNEAIDQALAESVVTYASQSARARDTFLAMLSHDLRGPIATVSLSGTLLSQANITTESVELVAIRLKRTASVMSSMVNDLLEYARAELGGQMPMTYSNTDMLEICQAAIADASAVHPNCSFRLNATESTDGYFDRVRLQQVFTNLLNNAAQYRGDVMPVTMTMSSDAKTVTISIQNSGAPIPKEALDAIFDPMVQLAISPNRSVRPSTSLGLGLYIAKKIASAHGGSIEVQSSDDAGTIFSVVLPRVQE